MKYWIFYLIAAVLCLHPHLGQKIQMLVDYFNHPDYEFLTTFSTMDILDLILHAGLPILLMVIGIKKQLAMKNE
jgi:hypothetical protein